MNGALGPPLMATATAPRHTARTTVAVMPAIRSVRSRRPVGSANTGRDRWPGEKRFTVKKRHNPENHYILGSAAYPLAGLAAAAVRHALR